MPENVLKRERIVESVKRAVLAEFVEVQGKGTEDETWIVDDEFRGTIIDLLASEQAVLALDDEVDFLALQLIKMGVGAALDDVKIFVDQAANKVDRR